MSFSRELLQQTRTLGLRGLSDRFATLVPILKVNWIREK